MKITIVYHKSGERQQLTAVNAGADKWNVEYMDGGSEGGTVVTLNTAELNAEILHLTKNVPS